MVYNSLRIKIIIRVVLISLSVFLILFGYQIMHYVLTPSVILLLVIFQISELIYTIEKYFRNYNTLLRSIKYHDFTSSLIISPKDKILKEQKAVVDEISQAFQDVRIEKENHYLYLNTLVEHLNTGIISFDGTEKINIINTAAKKTLGIEYIQNLASLKQINVHFYNTIKEIKPGERKTVQFTCKTDVCHLLLRCTSINMQSTDYKLISFQNIKQELDIKEQESWHKLIRILNHEVMNSMTPIVSLSRELNDTFFDESGNKVPIKKISNEDFEDIYLSAKTIEKRSLSLLNFVKTYRSFAALPKPDLRTIELSDIISGISKLLQSKIAKKGITFIQSKQTEPTTVLADRDLMEQVLINLMLNAIEAVQEKPEAKIWLEYGKENNYVFIRIKDNGKGIPAEYIDKVFVPFFTTKKKGSGIGLSLSKQILLAHKGNITVSSSAGKGTAITVKIPKE